MIGSSIDATATHIPEVTTLTPQIEAIATGSTSGLGRGGMASKLIAATGAGGRSRAGPKGGAA